MVTLIVALVLGLVLASYLMLIRAQHVSVVRSQAWHAALTAAEAGIEEALAQMNPAPLVTNVTLGWSSSNHLASGSYSVSYAPGSPPVICSTGYATVPAVSATITRTIEVKTTLAPLFSVGAAIRGFINMNGKKLMTDSYNSETWPHVYDPTRANQRGDLASSDGLIDLSEADIAGRLYLGATATNVPSANLSVSGGFSTDMSVEFPEVLTPVPQGSVHTPRPGTDNGTPYTYYLGHYGDRYYETNFLYGSIFVATNADVVLYVSGTADIDSVVVSPGASLTLYVGGPRTTFGNVRVNGKAADFQYFGLPGNTNITIQGSDKFTGVIYAPNANLRAGERVPGEPYVDTDIYGAIVVNSLDMHSDLLLHFDENLLDVPANGPVRGFVIASWRELPPP